jgi:hypothetical protein
VATQTSDISQRFRKLPRAIHWLIYAVVFVLLFQGWYRFVRPKVEDWNQAADEIAAQVTTVRAGAELATRLRRIDDTVCAIGPVKKPGDENEASQALTQAYVDVMKNYSVDNDSFDLRGAGGLLPPALSRGLVRGDNRLRRLTADLTFEAYPEDAVAIIGDFERREEIEAVTGVRLTRIANRKLKVTLTIEAWAEVPRGN